MSTSATALRSCLLLLLAGRTIFVASFSLTSFQHQHHQRFKAASSSSSSSTQLWDSPFLGSLQTKNQEEFDLEKALFCGGLAFDVYVKPAEDSSRWERGSKGMNVAFVSAAFTRNIYKGIIQVRPLSCSGLPKEDEMVESIVTGGGADACLKVACIEGQWKEDIAFLSKEMYHEGIEDLSGAAHVGKSSTAWSNVDENESKKIKKRRGRAPAYHIPAGWGRDGAAVWTEDETPFYLYLQDPATVQLVFTLWDDDRVGTGKTIGSAYKKLSALIPKAKMERKDLINDIKKEVVRRYQKGELKEDQIEAEAAKMVKDATSWKGKIKLTSKPRKKDKNGQVMMAAAAGAAVAGPLGGAVGAAFGAMYEGEVKGQFEAELSYLPIQASPTDDRKRYTVMGGLPGINWGSLHKKFLESDDNDEEEENDEPPKQKNLLCDDLEQCFFIEHGVTGGCCVVYRSLEKKLVVVSFRGTCELKDVATDVLMTQSTWVAGEDPKEKENVIMVHDGFRNSMESIARRLKELVLATPAPGESMADYDMLVTGHSLGGALATLFTADIGEHGIDAGRALPQVEESDAWWKSITNTFMGNNAMSGGEGAAIAPPRPKSLRLYNFGSPRVGNKAFADKFDELLEDGRVIQAYRIVNGDDIVTRMPRSMNVPGFGGVNYEHVGSTVMVSTDKEIDDDSAPKLWIEGESDDSKCPVRDLDLQLSSPLAQGSLLGEIVDISKDAVSTDENAFGKLSSLASKVAKRATNLKASDLTSIVGISKEFSDREFRIIESFAKGQAIANHMEDDYYAAMGRSCGFRTLVGEDIVPLEEMSNSDDSD